MRLISIYWFVILFLYLAIFSACTRKPVYPEALSQALLCMEAQPDSALYYLKLIPDSMLRIEPEETRMLHGLLTIKANDKLYNRHTSDSLIKAIVHFYDKYGDRQKQMEAYYYLGSVCRDMRNAPFAIKAFQRVVELGENTTEYGLLSKTYMQIGSVLNLQNVFEEAEIAGRQGLKYSMLLNDSEGEGYALRNIGRTFHDRNQLDSALFYYMQGYERSSQPLKNKILSEMPWLYFDSGQPEKAKSLINELFEQKEYSNNNWLLLGFIYLQEGELAKARDCLNKVLGKGTIYQIKSAYQKLFEIEKQAGDFASALAYADKYLKYQDSVNRWTQTETTAKIRALYNFQLYEEENNKLQEMNQRHQIWIFALSFGLLVLLMVGALYYDWIRRKKAKVLHLAKTARLLKELSYQNNSVDIEENTQKIKTVEAQSNKAEEEKDYFQKRLCEAEKELSAYVKQGVANSRSKVSLLELNFKKSEIYRFFHQWTERSPEKLSDEKWRELHIAIDIAYPRFTDRLLLLCPKLSEMELRICYLIKISISIKMIASMLSRSNPAITNARIRMHKKLKGEDGKADMFDQFISDL